MPANELHPIFQNIVDGFMPRATGPTEADLERLNAAHQTCLRADAAFTTTGFDADARAYVRATNVLVDHCVRCGMPTDYPDHEAWAAERVTRWLSEA